MIRILTFESAINGVFLFIFLLSSVCRFTVFSSSFRIINNENFAGDEQTNVSKRSRNGRWWPNSSTTTTNCEPVLQIWVGSKVSAEKNSYSI